MNKTAVAFACIALAGCGTFPLASGVNHPSKTQQEMQLDTLACKDRARLAASSAERQAGAFALGLTIIGAPLAYELDKRKQREVFKSCMEARGYEVLPPADGQSSAAPAPGASPADNATAQLEHLRDLRQKGLITEAEYQQKRQVILERL